ncbi:MAG: hypothetical protein GY913_18975 [Proteobacteria bacterium]|nr:hypothetical protein [Pseudomonadota bacterium]MCP4918993.1 hypothetical protein [Pseudomonadota bacterium]
MLLSMTALAHAAPIAGTYALAATPDEVEATLDTAIDGAVAEFPSMIQGIARGRLENAAHHCQTYVLQATEDSWSNQCDSMPPLERPMDGTAATVDVRGKTVEVSVRRKGDVVRQQLKAESGTRTNTFRFVDDEVLLTVSVASASLDKPMEWTLRYVKQ